MKRYILLLFLLPLSFVKSIGQSDTLSYDDIIRYYDSKSRLIDFYQSSGNSEKVSLLINERNHYIETLRDNYGKGAFYLGLSNYHSSHGNYSEAIRLGTEAMVIWKKVLGMEHPNYALSLSFLADYYSDLSNYSEAIRLGTEAMGIRKNVLGTEHPDYATSLANLATYNAHLGNYSEAIRLGTEAMEIHKKVFGTKHPEYATSLNNLAFFNSHLGNYSEALRLGAEALGILKKVLGTEHPDYATLITNLALYFFHLRNYSEAIRLNKEAIEIFKRVLGTEHPEYARTITNLSVCYSELGNYSEAIRLNIEAMEIKKKVFGIEHTEYATTLSNLALNYSELGNYSEAIHLGTEAMEILKKVLGTGHPDYATSLANLGDFYSDLGNYSEAIRLGTKAMVIRKKVLGTKHPNYALSLIGLAKYNAHLGNYHESIRLVTEAMEVYKTVFGTEDPYYALSLSNLASIYSFLGNYTESIRLGTEAMEVYKKIFGTEFPDYALSLSKLANYYSDLSNYSEAIRLGTEAMEIRKKVLGTEHPDYATSLANLATYNARLGNYSEAYFIMNQFVDISQNLILHNFSGLSSGLQESLWKSICEFEFNSLFPSIVYKCYNSEAISSLFDKTALFAKGILLNTGIAMRKLILESGDASLIAKYDAFSANVSIYDKQQEKPIKERFLNLDSLRSVIQQQEMELARDSKAYGDYAKSLRINWKDVQQRLNNDDIAIEFLDFPVCGTDSTMYVALTLRKGYDNPHMVTLFEKKQLKGISESIYYTSDRLYGLIWKPLEEELSGVKDIYFSPSGELHRIGIEYVTMSMTEKICDKYTLHRLSSTRQLAFIQGETKGEKSVLYGGLEYEGKSGSTSTGTSAAERIAKDRGLAYLCPANVDSLGLRGSYEYLPGTKEEGDQIASNLKKHSIPYLYYSGKTGTEESFKFLDGTKPRILHIATHGFYLTERDAVRIEFFRPVQLEDRRGYCEDKPMTRSGLLLSGCYPALNHETIPEGVEDGILTAQEISKIDLRGLDLVVLSACQTGLGDIISGEGVFGLQRGFKQAGAKTIIMSLWKVSDSATQQLMVSFYSNYLGGMSKEQAFRIAQDELRKHSTLTQKKPDWAAFVMLDGIL